jgi:hypothetical protein
LRSFPSVDNKTIPYGKTFPKRIHPLGNVASGLGMPQAGILANKRLRRKLAPFVYFESTNTPGLWYHKSCPITFSLVVDNFGIKYENKDDRDHLIASLKRITCSPRIGRATYIVG